MNYFYHLFLKPHSRQGSLTSKIKHFQRDSLPILGWSYFQVIIKFLLVLQCVAESMPNLVYVYMYTAVKHCIHSR